MKKNILMGALLLAAALTLPSCNQKEPAAGVKSNGLPKAGAAATTATTAGVAVVNIDTLASQYEYCKEGQKQLEAKQASLSKQLNQKGAALQKAMADFQQKAQSGAFTSQQQGEAAQKKLVQQQEQLQKFQAGIEQQMMTATKDYQDKLREQLQAFLKEYNKDGRFKVILSQSGDNILYAAPTVDITADVVAGLNKSYKK